MNIFTLYYHQDLKAFYKSIIPKKTRVIFLPSKSLKGKYDYIILPNTLAYIEDIQLYIKRLKKHCDSKTRIITVYFNFFWKPFLNLAIFFGLRKKEKREPNWLTTDDINNLFTLEGYDLIESGKRYLFPVYLYGISIFLNRIIGQLPLINNLCLTTFSIFKLKASTPNCSVSIVIPARNEEKNIKHILNKIPPIGTKTEVIFVEGHSQDNTFEAIKHEVYNNKTSIKASFYKQTGKGKADAVRLGFQKAKNDLLMILDADLSVNPTDLSKFYHALIEGHCELANGCRLIYPMEKDAMRYLNYIGNGLFSFIFTYLLGQKIKDTLCGTKALFKKDYLKIIQNKKMFGDFDPFGDFDLLFGASKLNYKIRDIPIRYKERVYGKTNINRFQHGWLLIKMIVVAARKIKFT